MKILFIVTKSAWGGAQRYVYDLATRLPMAGFDTAVAAGGDGPLLRRLAAAGGRAIAVPELARDVSAWQDVRALSALIRLICRERPDVVHLSSSKVGGLSAVAALVSKLLTLNLKPLTIFTVHGWPFSEDRARWQRAIIFFFSWLSTVFHDRVIVIDTADHCAARWFVPERKLALIGHGIGPIDFLPRGAARAFFAERAGQTFADTAMLIGANAELTKNKGLAYAVDSISRVRSKFPISNFKFLVIGEGEDRENLQRQIHTLGLKNYVFLLGFIPESSRYLKGLDLFVLPSVKEGLPYAIMEAMAAGLPIVASRVGGIPDLITDGESGVLLPPGDPAALAAALGALLEGPERRHNLGDAARRDAERRFSIEAMVRNTAAVYRGQPA